MGADAPQEHCPRRDVGLALRADRRRQGQSQRAYAAARGLVRETLAKAEVDAGPLRLEVLMGLLEGTGYELAVLPTEERRQAVAWDPTDLEARTRSGSRFPANRKVRTSARGPTWWLYHEYLGTRPYGPQPAWTAQGFIPPAETRYGKTPRPYADGEGARWPY